MMDKGKNMIKQGAKKMEKCYVCKVCGKEGQKPVIKGHIEANHLEGISIPCNLCDKTFRLRSSVIVHKDQHHKFITKYSSKSG